MAMLAHNVFFTLEDASDEAVQSLLDACHEHLSNHPGTVSFSAGRLVKDLERPVNVRDFHVGLHLVFESRQAHDDYQTSPRHLQFIEENKANWQQARVFDTTVTS